MSLFLIFQINTYNESMYIAEKNTQNTTVINNLGGDVL